MAAKLDRSGFSLVVWCPDCPSFAQLAGDVGHGYDLAVAHELSIHPGMKDAMSNRAAWRKNLVQSAQPEAGNPT